MVEHGDGISSLAREMRFGLADHARTMRILFGDPAPEIFEHLGVEITAYSDTGNTISPLASEQRPRSLLRIQ